MSSGINYSQSWEDAEILQEALNVSPLDSVLSITSGGDNTLALLLNGPSELTTIDMHAAQNYLFELKLAAARNVEYEAYLELVGVRTSTRRVDLYAEIKPHLREQTALWWSSRHHLIEKGIIHIGKFETFLNAFRMYVLPCAHSKYQIKRFVETSTLKEQVHFYESTWNTWRWRLFFRLASGRKILEKFARQKEMTVENLEKNTPHSYLERLESHIRRIPLRTNFFMHYCLLGRYGDTVPMYLTKNGYTKLREISLDSVHIETGNIFEYLKTKPENTFSKCNMSDIFDALSKVHSDALWSELARVVKNGGRVAFWSHQVKHGIPESRKGRILELTDVSKTLHAKDKVFFYESFNVYTITK